jgi:hypothetical protein
MVVFHGTPGCMQAGFQLLKRVRNLERVVMDPPPKPVQAVWRAGGLLKRCVEVAGIAENREDVALFGRANGVP